MKIGWGTYNSSPLIDTKEVYLREDFDNGEVQRAISWKFHIVLASSLLLIIIFLYWNQPKNPVPTITKSLDTTFSK